MSLWSRYARQSAIVLRAAIVGGKRGLPVVHLSGLQATTPQPMTGQDAGALLQRIGWDTPHVAKECYIVGHQDVITGDTISIDGTNYLVRQAAKWSPLGSSGAEFMQLVLEEVAHQGASA
jgi:hypothetical protein